MLFKILATAGFLAATVAADGAAIVAALKVIQKDNAALNTSVVHWEGEFITAAPILGNTITLNNDLSNATTVAKNSAALSTDESLAIANSVNALSSDVDITVTSIIDAYPKFKKQNLTGITLISVQTTKKNTDDFGAAVVEKVPEELKSAAQTIIDGIDAKFQKAIDKYSS